MNRRTFVDNLLKAIFAVLLFVGSIALFAQNFVVLVEMSQTHDSTTIGTFLVHFVYAVLIGACLFALGVRALLDISARKVTDLKNVYFGVLAIGVVSFLTSIIEMAVANIWDGGRLWGQFVVGLALTALAVLVLFVRVSRKNLLSLLAVICTASYFIFIYARNATLAVNVEMVVSGAFALAYLLVTAVLFYRVFRVNPEVEEVKVEEAKLEESNEDKEELSPTDYAE